MIVGEPGIGKTRLAEEVAEEAEWAGASVGWGRSHDGQGEVAFRAWSQVVATLVERVPGPLVVDALGHGVAADIARIAPEVRDLGIEIAGPAPAEPDLAQARLADALVAFLRSLAQARPLVVVLDDIQWADPASLRVLAVVAREIADARLLVVATYRSVGAPAHAQLADALAVVVRQPIARRFDLVGLDRGGLEALVGASGGTRSDDELAAIHRRTQGNPFFAVEVLRLLAGDDEATGADQPVPAGVRDVVRQRLRALPDATNEVLDAASVLGLDIDVATVGLALGIDATDVLDRLEPALDHGVVVAASGPLALRFSHGLVSETAYADLSVVGKLRGHQRAADALAARHGSGDGPHLADIAAHRCRAVPVGSTEDAVADCVRAATWLVGHVAHQHADELLVRALELIAALPAGPARDAEELRVLDRLWLLRIMTQGYGTPGARDAVQRMGELCEAIGDLDVVAPVVWRLVNYLCVAAVFGEAHRLSSRLLAGAADNAQVAQAAHLAMGITLTHMGQVAEARPHFDAVGDDPLEEDTGTGTVYVAWNRLLSGEESEADALVAEAADVVCGRGCLPVGRHRLVRHLPRGAPAGSRGGPRAVRALDRRRPGPRDDRVRPLHEGVPRVGRRRPRRRRPRPRRDGGGGGADRRHRGPDAQQRVPRPQGRRPAGGRPPDRRAGVGRRGPAPGGALRGAVVRGRAAPAPGTRPPHPRRRRPGRRGCDPHRAGRRHRPGLADLRGAGGGGAGDPGHVGAPAQDSGQATIS